MTLKQLAAAMKDAGASQFYSKRMAANDNSKHGVVLSGDFTTLNIFPNLQLEACDSSTSEKEKAGVIYKAKLNFSWIGENGTANPAPSAQLILYPQYPEVRFTGFLRGCATAPSDLMNSTGEGRVLILGVGGDGKVLGCVAAADSDIARQEGEEVPLTRISVLRQLDPKSLGIAENPRVLLVAALRRINEKDWIDSFRLGPNQAREECKGTNCGGYTLEGELGILPNGFSEPDFHGWEIKQHAVDDLSKPGGGKAITLMTPEPTGGLYRTEGIIPFITKFGYADKKGIEDRRNFSSPHSFGTRNTNTNLLLTLEGFDAASEQFTNMGAGISLMTEDGDCAASWSYLSLLEHWTRKHALAAYVPSVNRTTPKKQYKYGQLVRLGEATDFILFLRAVASGKVYYDPGIKLENATSSNPKPKKRSQFRIKSADVGELYKAFGTVDVRT